MVSRRLFLQSASASLGVGLLDRIPYGASQVDLEKTFAEIRANLLEMINEERAVAKVLPLAMDELAAQVATKHAVDMATGEFASHWGRDGLKPYHRYSFAGGTQATQENVSAADNTWSMKIADLKQDTAYLHVRLYQEKPPNDGHRQTILAPQHTHVGFGLAVEKLRLRMVELFVAKYLVIEPVRRTAKPGEQVVFAGKLKPGQLLNHIEVFYEPLPKAPELSWLREPRSYALPNESKVLRPKVPPPYMYADRTAGVIEVSPDGSFRSPVKSFKNQPGIYTIVTWIKANRSDKAFPATEVCIRTE
jgi:uncharacterized protein YkwD